MAPQASHLEIFDLRESLRGAHWLPAGAKEYPINNTEAFAPGIYFIKIGAQRLKWIAQAP